MDNRKARAATSRKVGVGAVINGDHMCVAANGAESADVIVVQKVGDFSSFAGVLEPFVAKPRRLIPIPRSGGEPDDQRIGSVCL